MQTMLPTHLLVSCVYLFVCLLNYYQLLLITIIIFLFVCWFLEWRGLRVARSQRVVQYVVSIIELCCVYRRELLAFSLTHCTPDVLESLLNSVSLLETQVSGRIFGFQCCCGCAAAVAVAVATALCCCCFCCCRRRRCCCCCCCCAAAAAAAVAVLVLVLVVVLPRKESVESILHYRQ